MKLASILLGTMVLLVLSSDALAEVKRANGGACESVGTARRDAKDGNKLVNCQFDTCTYSECNAAGSTISGCVTKTEYSNATDCHAARVVNQSIINPNLNLQIQVGPKVDPSNGSLSSTSGGAAPAPPPGPSR